MLMRGKAVTTHQVRPCQPRARATTTPPRARCAARAHGTRCAPTDAHAGRHLTRVPCTARPRCPTSPPRACVSRRTQPLDPPLCGIAPGYNFVGSQGFVYEATAVQEAIAQGLTEHPELPLSETLAMARVFDDIRGQIGLKYPWDEPEVDGARK